MTRGLPLFAVLLIGTMLLTSNLYLLSSPLDTSIIVPSDPSITLNAGKDVHPESTDEKKLLLIHAQTRPLFSPTRRPWVAPPAAAALVPEPVQPEPVAVEPVVAVEVQPPQVTLLGIEITPTGSKALTLRAGEADASWLRAGELLDGWTVQKIERTSIELENGSRSITLELYPAYTPPSSVLDGAQP
jgi:hypothetical protein